ncbi:regulator of chromosome condensation 1/beta-lactamase-inhibitor protein II [Catenaria anguillulae PL171]|uniref:Regulator of chromosome condensation 1/beta-lactamase-inhibitor protein II n=1 Tax=Catenaria anguillulae PL171 TaxID=765915 RepID=A0A1Y2HAA4_9FUNG|nr:regulator of chromosome condensation 1/beta-lactamase-inhibitor protein II [Catenaria anguillulae PL171]
MLRSVTRRLLPHLRPRRDAAPTPIVITAGIAGAAALGGAAFVNLIPGDSPPSKSKVTADSSAAKPAPPQVHKFDASGLPEFDRNLTGVYMWGTNCNGVVDPQLSKTDPAAIHVAQGPTDMSTDTYLVKYPKRVHAFNGMRFRHVALAESSAAAIDANGDLYQWGSGFSNSQDTSASSTVPPTKTLVGHDLVRVSLSKDHLFALSRTGKLLVLPISANAQAQVTGNHPISNPTQVAPANGWFSRGQTDISKLKTFHLSSSSKDQIVDVASGSDHVLALTKSGAVYSAALSARGVHYGSIGRDPTAAESLALQAALPPPPAESSTPSSSIASLLQESTSISVPPVPIPLADISLLPLPALSGSTVTQIAVGSAHSLALTADGRAYAWGSNAFGQLGLGDWTRTNQIIALPAQITVPKRTALVDQVAAAGDMSALVTIDRTYGTLGNGQFAHVQSSPAHVRALSGMAEYSEADKKVVGMKPQALVLAPNHGACVLGMYPASVYFWGTGAEYATGLGTRSHQAKPVLAGPLPWKYGFRAAGKGVVGPENGDQVDQMVVEQDQRIAVGPGVSCVYHVAKV